MHYTEDDMLMLSGIQHFMFCPRQWALIHVEQQWADNRLTTEGSLLHDNVDNPFYRQKNGDRITIRSLHIASKELGLYGIADAIELIPANATEKSISHPRYPGAWLPYPVEYKHGHSKNDECDEVQLCAQAICLEEMYGVSITEGAIFYFETRRREVVKLSEELRNITCQCSEEMHRIYSSGKLPIPVKKKYCRSCSLKDLCQPNMTKCVSVDTYLKQNLYEETT